MAKSPPASSLVAKVDPTFTRLFCSLVAIGLLVWSGLRARERGRAARTELRAAESALADFAGLRERYRPAVAAESIAWRRTWMELQSLGVIGDERLASTQYVARAAEFAGLRGVKVNFGPSDTSGLERRLSTEGVGRKPASFSLLVEGDGGLRSVIGFLSHLPPSAAPTSLIMVRQGSGARHRISLAVYELTFTNGPPPSSLWSPAQRSGTGDSRDSRPGG